MTPFNRTVITVAGIILIIVLVVVLFLVLSGATEDKFPPTIPTCPDYWTVSHDDQGSVVCKSTSGINTGSTNISSFNYSVDCPNFDINDIETLACPDGTLREWADSNSVHWDGVSNKRNCPAEEEEEEANQIKVPNSVIAAVVVGAIIIVCVSISAKK